MCFKLTFRIFKKCCRNVCQRLHCRFLLSSLILLFISSFLCYRLRTLNLCLFSTKFTNSNELFSETFCRTLPEPIRFQSGTGRFDNTRKYSIHDFVYVGNRWSTLSSTSQVCLATHTSIEQLFRVVELSETWQGLISLTIFVPGNTYQLIVLYFQHLSKCFESIRNNVSVHFVYPVNQPPHLPRKPLSFDWVANCHEWESSFKQILREIVRSKNKTKALYPQNHLRNVARKGCQTPFVFMVDVDIAPRVNLAHHLDLFLQNESCFNCAYVIPTYEIVDKHFLQLPKNKSSLLNLIANRLAQPYHQVIFPSNQKATNTSIWEKIPEGNSIKVAYPIEKFPFSYEPFYVARDNVPAHDERFVGYGFTRNTQTFEMSIAGYKFVVLNYAFATHRGLKFHRKQIGWRESQTNNNFKALKKFKKEIFVRYNYNESKQKFRNQ